MQIITATAVLAATTAAVGAVRARGAMRALYPPPLPGGGSARTPPHEPTRPTAALLLDHPGTEVSDFLLPYQLLRASEAFNVHAVAPELRPATLTGGLDVMPHLSLAGFETLPASHADLVVVPHLVAPDRRLIAWLALQSRSGAAVLSICTGAAVAAAAGILDGRRATSHWGDLGRLERRHPQVDWVRGQRYVEDGPHVASAGITSGIDATLHTIRRFAGDAAMQRAADATGYTDLRYLDDPTTGEYRVEADDLVLPLTAAFARRRRLGVLLEDGVDEAGLAAIMDTHAASFAARLHTISRDGLPVQTRHGLTVVPRFGAELAPHHERLLRPGMGHGAVPAAIADLEALAGRRLARFAAKRLEHRGTVTAGP